jgi:predicted CoA-binding protein
MGEPYEDSSGPTDPAANLDSIAAANDPVAEILKTSRVIAVVGLSSRPLRPSNHVGAYLQSAGYRVIPVNPQESEVLGEKAYGRLEDVPEKIDIVDIFRRSEFVAEIVDAAIRVGARAVWMQEGVVNAEAAERARQAGLFVMMNVCIFKEHSKRFGRRAEAPAGSSSG